LIALPGFRNSTLALIGQTIPHHRFVGIPPKNSELLREAPG